MLKRKSSSYKLSKIHSRYKPPPTYMSQKDDTTGGRRQRKDKGLEERGDLRRNLEFGTKSYI